MTDQSIQFPEGIAKDVMVRIHDHFAPTNFMVLDMGEEEDDIPIILGRPFLNTTNRSSTSDLDKSTSNSLKKRYVVISIVISLMNRQRRATLEGDIDHPDVKGTNPYGMNGRKMKNLKNLRNPLCLSQVHRPNRYGRKR